MIGEIRQNFTEASASVGLILATALLFVPFLCLLMFLFTCQIPLFYRLPA